MFREEKGQARDSLTGCSLTQQQLQVGGKHKYPRQSDAREPRELGRTEKLSHRWWECISTPMITRAPNGPPRSPAGLCMQLWEPAGLHSTIWETMQLKTYKLSLSGIFSVIFLYHSRTWKTKLWEMKLQLRGSYCGSKAAGKHTVTGEMDL